MISGDQSTHLKLIAVVMTKAIAKPYRLIFTRRPLSRPLLIPVTTERGSYFINKIPANIEPY